MKREKKEKRSGNKEDTVQRSDATLPRQKGESLLLHAILEKAERSFALFLLCRLKRERGKKGNIDRIQSFWYKTRIDRFVSPLPQSIKSSQPLCHVRKFHLENEKNLLTDKKWIFLNALVSYHHHHQPRSEIEVFSSP